MSTTSYPGRFTDEATKAAFSNAKPLNPEEAQALDDTAKEAHVRSIQSLTDELEQHLQAGDDSLYQYEEVNVLMGDMKVDVRRINLVRIDADIPQRLGFVAARNCGLGRHYGVSDGESFTMLSLLQIFHKYGEDAVRAMALSLIANRERTGLVSSS